MTPSRNPLSSDEIKVALRGLPGWSLADNHLEKEFTFSNFREAVSFMVRVAFSAESLDHHPEMVNVYNRVIIRLSTHDAGNRVTGMDVKLARDIEEFSWV